MNPIEYHLESVSSMNGLPLFYRDNTGGLTKEYRSSRKDSNFSVVGQSQSVSAPFLRIDFSGLSLFANSFINPLQTFQSPRKDLNFVLSVSNVVIKTVKMVSIPPINAAGTF